MKILYVAKHDSGGNDEEGAITSAFARLGHDVVKVRESRARQAKLTDYKADLLFFHKWYDVNTLVKIRCPKVFWYFDLVDFPDVTLQERCSQRKQWFASILPQVDLGFCTDGDWVENNRGQPRGFKLHWLPQGFDDRGAGPMLLPEEKTTDILFTGGRRGGVGRESFVDEMTRVYGDRFRHVQNGLHGAALGRAIAASKIVVAPDSPVTDRYWSNRVYLSTGYGGYVLHPYARRLAEQYEERAEIEFYWSRSDLHERVSRILQEDSGRQLVAEAGRYKTLTEHTYFHRCRSLLATVKDCLGVS